MGFGSFCWEWAIQGLIRHWKTCIGDDGNEGFPIQPRFNFHFLGIEVNLNRRFSILQLNGPCNCLGATAARHSGYK